MDDGRSSLTRRHLLAGASSGLALLPRSSLLASTPRPAAMISLSDFGCIGDGETDDGPRFAQALAEAGRRGVALQVPRGTYLITDRHVHRSGDPLALGPGLMLFGTGAGSVLRFRRTSFPSFYGLTLARDGVHLHDLVLEVDNGGSGWAAAIGVSGPVRNVRFARVGFRGFRRRNGHYGVLPLNADMTAVQFDQCHFESLDFGFSKQTTDTSTQTGLSFVDCTATDCTEVLEFNSPGLFFGHARAGSPRVSGITDESGGSFDVTRLKPGQEVRSPYFPAGTVVVSVPSAGQMILSAAALRSNPVGDKARFSAGGCRDGRVRNLRVRNIGQWAVGLAKCQNWDIEVYGEDVAYELVHIEDGSHDIRIVAGGARCNLSPGVVGSPRADNGMVHISTGSHTITTRLDADLTQNGGSANGLCVQAGGMMGTTGLEVDPRDIEIAGRVRMRAAARAVVAYNSDLRFNGFELVDVDPAPRREPMMRLHGSTWSGTLRVRNAGPLVEPHPLARGHFDEVIVLPG